MRRMMKALLLATCLALPVQAATVDGVTLPDTYPVVGETLVLNGIGVRTVTIFNVRAYVAGLYLPRRNASPSAIMGSPGPKVLLMQFLHAASKAQIEHQYREGESNNCGHGECPASDAADFERLVEATPAAAVGDTLTYIITPAGMQVLANNRLIGEFTNPDLGLRVLSGFIGPRPPSEALKAELLGQKAE